MAVSSQAEDLKREGEMARTDEHSAMTIYHELLCELGMRPCYRLILLLGACILQQTNKLMIVMRSR